MNFRRVVSVAPTGSHYGWLDVPSWRIVTALRPPTQGFLGGTGRRGRAARSQVEWWPGGRPVVVAGERRAGGGSARWNGDVALKALTLPP
jgi:hypothetical protein